MCWPFVFQPLKMFESFAKLIIDFLELPVYPKINPLLDAEFENMFLPFFEYALYFVSGFLCCLKTS